MKKNLLYVALLAPGLLLSAACGADRTANGAMAETSVLSDENHAGHDEEDNEEHRGWRGEHVELSADEVVASGIVIAEAERGDVSVPLELPAEIRFDADRVARVSSKVEGNCFAIVRWRRRQCWRRIGIGTSDQQGARRLKGRLSQCAECRTVIES